MQVFIWLLIIFILILIFGMISFVFLKNIIDKKDIKKLNWKWKYSKQISIGIIVFAISGIVINFIEFF